MSGFDASFGGPSFDSLSKKMDSAMAASNKRMDEAQAASEERMNKASEASNKKMDEAAAKINRGPTKVDANTEWDKNMPSDVDLEVYGEALSGEWETFTSDPIEELPPEIDMSNIEAPPEGEAENSREMKAPSKENKTENPLNDQPTIRREGVSGKYIITESDNEHGFDAKSNFKVGMNHEANKFFGKASTIAMDKKDQITRNEDGSYSFRGIKSKSLNILQQKITMTSQKISGNNAIYNDLLSKQQSGTELTGPEKNFMNAHLQNIAKYGLGVDANGNLIDKMK